MRQLLQIILLIFTFDAYAEQAQVAIIIDDIGYRESDLNALSLPGNITYSILPQTPFGQTLAKKAYAENHEVMLHIPMEAENGKELGPGALTSAMSEENIRSSLTRSFEEIPFAVGINNHMGSLLTKMYNPMAWTMRFLKERDMVFVDSVTTRKSKAQNVARYFGVPSLHRHIFLDNELTLEYISQQFMKLVGQAQRNKYAVAIAHPHPETIAALTALLPLLEDNNIELVTVSQLLSNNRKASHIALVADE